LSAPAVGRFLECGEDFEAGEFAEDPADWATFLNVIVHLTSSPAKTVWSCQRMKTRMLP